MDDYERLFLLCAVRQSYELTTEFNHLSGLKFLIKRVFASSHTIHLHQLNSLAGTIHSTELLIICARLGNTVCILNDNQHQKRHSLVATEKRVTDEMPASTFVDYYRKWAVRLVDSYCCSFGGAFHSEPSRLKIQTQREDNEEAQEISTVDGDEDGLVDVALERNAGQKSLSSASLLIDTVKRYITEEEISGYLVLMAESINKKKSVSNIAEPLQNDVNNINGVNSRKNPFREPVTPSTELPSEVAQELLTAMEEVKVRSVTVYLNYVKLSIKY